MVRSYSDRAKSNLKIFIYTYHINIYINMGLDRIFSESTRELPEGERKCFMVIPPDSKAIKIKQNDAHRISHIELAGKLVYLADSPIEDNYVVLNLGTGARFTQFVLSETYIEACEKVKYIVGKKKTEDGSGEFEDRAQVDISVVDATSLDSETFKGEKFVTYIKAVLPEVVLVSKD